MSENELEEINKAELRERIVRTLLEKHSFVTMRETHELYVYENGVYKLGVAEALINNHAEMVLATDGTKYDVNEIIFKVKCRTYADWDFWELEDKFICVDNGILNIEDMILQEHSPDFHFLNKLPVVYVPEEKLSEPTWGIEDLIDKFIHEIVATQEDVDALYEFFGYCLYRRMPIHKALMLLGKGANGKSTLLDLLVAFLGSENISNQTLQEICENRFSTVELHGKLANIRSDIPRNALNFTGKFKELTGWDVVDAERKFIQRRVKFQNYAKQIYSCNEPPANTYDDTPAFWRRWIIINFPNMFSKQQGNLDPDILQKLTTKEQLSMLLLHALKGLKRLLANNVFSNEKTVDETRLDYIIKSDPIKYFAEINLEQDTQSFEPKIVVYEAYKQFCNENELNIVDSAVFSKKLRKFLTFYDAQKTVNGKHGVTCYGGIKLKSKLETENRELSSYTSE